MSDNKQFTGQQDRIRIDANDPSEVERVHSQFPHFQHTEIAEAIRKYGPMREDVVAHLKGKSAKRNSL